MKVVPNGGLNLSVLDGWWPEGYSPETGWAIGKGEDYADHAYQDHLESNALYDLLEKDVVPLFYQRAADGLPRAWIARMKQSMKHLAPRFSANRMVWDYVERYYLPAARHHESLVADGGTRAKGLAEWRARVIRQWPQVKIEQVEAARSGTHRVGESLLGRRRTGRADRERRERRFRSA
jgi:starch phosphorylase